MNRQLIDISWWSLIKILVVVGALWILWLIKSVLVLGFFVVVMVAALSPVVDKWSQKIHRGFAVSLIYLMILFIIGLIAGMIIPPLAVEIQDLALSLPSLYTRLASFIGSSIGNASISTQLLDSVSQGLSSVGSSLVSTTRSVVDGIVSVFTVLVLSFYLLLEEKGGRKLLIRVLPVENREQIALIAQKIGLKMGAWLRGQLTLGILIGIIDFIILLLLGVPFALTLAVWAGVTELIPYIGPVLGAIPAVIVGFTISPLTGFLVLIAYVLIQQIEANFLVPKIMGKAVGLSPVVIIFAILIGAQLAGVLGIIIAVPAAAAISVLVQEWPTLKRKI